MYSFNQLQEIIQKKISEQNFITSPENLFLPIDYILSAGGKRLRPVMVLMAVNLFNENVKKAILPALGIEIFHNFTLLHDDVMDDAPMRRNKDTVHEKWNSNIAILSGDAMSIKAYEYILSCNNKHLRMVLNTFNQAALDVCKGQQYDMEFENRNDVTTKEYLKMIRLKTAALLGGSLKIGAILADAGTKNANSLYYFGINLGMAFQLQDDLLDVYGDEKIFGKKIGGDITANKKTYLLTKSLELAKGELRDVLLKQIVAKRFNREKKIAAVRGIYNQLGIKQLTIELIEYYTSLSLEYLDKVGVEASRKKELYALVKNLLNRSV